LPVVCSNALVNKRERVRATLAGQPVDRLPASLWGHEFLREWDMDDLVAQTLELCEPYDWDFIKFNPRATYFAEAWGSRYEPPSAQRQPRLVSAVVQSAEDLARIEPVDHASGVFGDHLRALRTLVAQAGDVDILHTVFSPLSVAAMLCGAPQTFRTYAEQSPAAAHTAVRAAATTLTSYARAAIAAGAAGIFFAPLTWASRDTCNEDFYAAFGRPYDLQVLDAVRDAPFNVLHVCRNHNMLASLLDYPVAAFNWADRGDGNPSLAEIRQRTKAAVMGGVDQARIATMAPEEVAAQARDAIDSVERGLFLTAGCAIPPETPAANRRALADVARATA
jgi:uroporphyrinogen decarboxylase